MTNQKITELKEIAQRFLGFGKEKPAIPPVVETQQTFEAFKIKGGDTMVEIDPLLTVGSAVMVSSGTGSQVAVDQAYELETGAKFTVKDGKIESVQATAEAPADAPEKFEITKEMFEAVTTKLDAVSTELAGYKEQFGKLDTLPTAEVLVAFSQGIVQVGTALEAFALVPADVQGSPEAVVTQITAAQGFENAAVMFANQAAAE